MEYVKDFDQWAKDCYCEYKKVRDKSEPARFIQGTSGRLINNDRTFIIDTYTNKVGIAKCHPDDKFNAFIGLGVAYAKLVGKEIPKEIKIVSVTSLTKGQEFLCEGKKYIFVSKSMTFRNLYICEEKGGMGVHYLDSQAHVTIIE